MKVRTHAVVVEVVQEVFSIFAVRRILALSDSSLDYCGFVIIPCIKAHMEKCVCLLGSKPATPTSLVRHVSLPAGKRVHSSRGEGPAFNSSLWELIDACLHVLEDIFAFEQL